MILRHGKADKEAPSRRDADRPLAPRGIRQAEHIAAALAKPHPPLARPTIILASRAERAKHTATIVADALGMAVTFEDALTLGNSTKQALTLIRTLTERNQPALLVGHNPQLEDLVSTLTGTESSMSTGELVALDVKLSAQNATARELARFRLEEDD